MGYGLSSGRACRLYQSGRHRFIEVLSQSLSETETCPARLQLITLPGRELYCWYARRQPRWEAVAFCESRA